MANQAALENTEHAESKCPACVLGVLPMEAYADGKTEYECAFCMDTKTVCKTCYAQMGVEITEQKGVTNG